MPERVLLELRDIIDTFSLDFVDVYVYVVVGGGCWYQHNNIYSLSLEVRRGGLVISNNLTLPYRINFHLPQQNGFPTPHVLQSSLGTEKM